MHVVVSSGTHIGNTPVQYNLLHMLIRFEPSISIVLNRFLGFCPNNKICETTLSSVRLRFLMKFVNKREFYISIYIRIPIVKILYVKIPVTEMVEPYMRRLSSYFLITIYL